MTHVRGVRGRNNWLGRIVFGALAFSLLVPVSWARDRYLVKPDGRKYRLVRSDSEFAVTFRENQQVKYAAHRIAAVGGGIVVDVPQAPYARVKLLRVANTGSARRNLLRADPAVEEVHPVYYLEGSDAPIMSTGTIALRLAKGGGDEVLTQLLADYHLTLIEPVEGLRDVFLVKPMADGEDEVLRAEALAADTRTLWAEPNFRVPQVRTQLAAPGDPLYSRQWHLNNTGQEGGISGADINAPQAWLQGAEGQDILIGMHDDSCDVDHEDLRSNYLGVGNDPSLPSTADGFDDPRPKQIGDQHGTAVMGLAVGAANGLGGRGVAYLSRFTASRGLGVLSDSQVANAFTFARQQKVDVHINSWSPFPPGFPVPSIIEEALETNFIEGRDLDADDQDEEAGDPPRGMVILFSSGNFGLLLEAGLDIATLPTVIGVGASNDRDALASYSNYGPEIDVLAPSNDDFTAGLVTTDNDDSAGYVDDGYNVGGISSYTGLPEIDGEGLYTGEFGGTSGACPIAAGVAALVLSINPMLTATDVRLILEHTCAQISPIDADYDGITRRSLEYGYGRIDAYQAVLAAEDSLINGRRTWPERPANVQAAAELGQLTWLQNGDPLEFREDDPGDDQSPGSDADILRTTNEFLVLESADAFEFVPEDGKCYHASQIGCTSAILEPLPVGVSVLAVGCGLTCDVTAVGTCEAGAGQCVGFLQPSGKKYFAVYARNLVGRYSFGVAADTDGNVTDNGQLPPRSAGGTTPGTGVTDPSAGPKVTISVSPLDGDSPLTVDFRGNASSVLEIDDARTAWDFDIGDDVAVDATTRNAERTYTVPAGESKTFIARLTMFDVAGNIGYAQVAIHVTGAGGTSVMDPVTDSDIRILVGVPGTVGSDIDSGQSPFQVELSISASSFSGTVQSVVWNLGDGTDSPTSLFVNHTYVNTTGVDLRIPITATVTTLTPGGTTVTTIVSRRIIVKSGTAQDDSDDSVPCDGCGAQPGNGTTTTACGAAGMLPLFLMIGALWCVRRRCC
ncbi:MAG: S8 family serine peptidase [Planctomycetes bacterium]|nr:S8 family serine peptidase [Planctomycetota bacterium]